MGKIIQSFQIDLDTKRAIDAEAERRGLSVSEFIRQAVLAQIGTSEMEGLQLALESVVKMAMRQSTARAKRGGKKELKRSA